MSEQAAINNSALSVIPKNASPLGLVVARILDDVWALYNLQGFDKIEWSHEDRVEVNISKTLATYDFDELTQLVVRCHDACVRLSIAPCNMRYVKLYFHKRAGRTGRMFDRHPTIEDAILRVRSRSYFGKVPMNSEVVPEPTVEVRP